MVTVLVTGGGTGGHVTPVKYIVEAMHAQRADVQVQYIGQRGDRFAAILDDSEHIAKSHKIFAGKYRRYPQVWWRTLLDIKTNALNVRDLFLLGFGSLQALRILRRERPDVVFSKGGFVSVGVCWAAHRLGIPVVVHESDNRLGLANKISGRWAETVFVGQSVENYASKAEARLIQSGIPINPDITALYGHAPAQPTLMIIGGSLGAASVNTAALSVAADLAKLLPVHHIVGADHFEEAQSQVADIDNYSVYDFVNAEKMAQLYKQASIVISRAGATSVAELAAMGKPTILVPGEQLSDQQQNAKVLSDANAAIVLQDAELADTLLDIVVTLEQDDTARKKLGAQFYESEGAKHGTAAITVAQEILRLAHA